MWGIEVLPSLNGLIQPLHADNGLQIYCKNTVIAKPELLNICYWIIPLILSYWDGLRLIGLQLETQVESELVIGCGLNRLDLLAFLRVGDEHCLLISVVRIASV